MMQLAQAGATTGLLRIQLRDAGDIVVIMALFNGMAIHTCVGLLLPRRT